MTLFKALPPGAILLGVVLLSDKMNISIMSGNHIAHPVLISLTNIGANICSKSSLHAYLLLALLPIINFTHKTAWVHSLLQDCLFYQALNIALSLLKIAAQVRVMMSDPVGNLHYCFTLINSFMNCRYFQGKFIRCHRFKSITNHYHHIQKLQQPTLTSFSYHRENSHCDPLCLFKVFAKKLQKLPQGHKSLGFKWHCWAGLGGLAAIKPLQLSYNWATTSFPLVHLGSWCLMVHLSACCSRARLLLFPYPDPCGILIGLMMVSSNWSRWLAVITALYSDTLFKII